MLAAISFNSARRDESVWQLTKTYSSSIMFKLLSMKMVNLTGPAGGTEFIRMIWAFKLPPRVQFFHWLVARDSISCNAVLARRGIIMEVNSGCFLCLQEETTVHILLHCHFAWQTWSRLMHLSNNIWVSPFSLENFYRQWSSLCRKKYRILWNTIWFFINWSLWKARNKRVFKFKTTRIDSIILDSISKAVLYYKTAHPSKRSGHQTQFALKLDISKAYDRLEWKFLCQMLKAWGFNQIFINWVMECVTSVSYSVLINGESCDFFRPSRGLRQGDPLSPLLFVLCSEGLGFKIKQAVARNVIKGIKIAKECPVISHLFFADDSIIFSQATHQDVTGLISVIEDYGRASGQLINFSKSAIFFSQNTDLNTRRTLANLLKVQNIGSESSYLGLPPFILRSKKTSFKDIIDKIERKLLGWKENLLSMAGKEILLKAVIAAIPVYSMMCFKLPLSLCKRINSLMSKFWWGSTQQKRKMSWVAWHKMCKSKWEGGLGFKDFNAFNQALLAKQAWRIEHNQQSLLFRILKGKYFPSSCIWKAPRKHNPSWGWRSLQHGLKLLNLGRRWQISSGLQMETLSEPWIPSAFPFSPRLIPGINREEVPATVHELICQQSHRWKEELLKSLFIEEDVAAILSIPLPLSSVPDRQCWHHNRSGRFSVKSGYYIALNSNQESHMSQVSEIPRVKWQALWNYQIPNKLKIFLWKVLSNGIPTAKNLNGRLQGNLVCPRCGKQEDRLHLFFLCDFVRRFWFSSPLSLLVRDDQYSSFSQAWICLTSQLQDLDDSRESEFLFCFFLWSIWKARNSLIFKDHIWSVGDTIGNASTYKQEFGTASIIQSEGAADFRRPPPSDVVSPPGTPVLNQHCLTIQYDAGTCAAARFGSVAGVAKDSSGRRVGSFSAIFRNIWDPGILEFLALREVMNWCISKAWTKVHFEGDAALVSQSINSGIPHSSASWGICNDIWHFKSLFEVCTFAHIPRKDNSEAHSLAQEAKDHFIWLSRVRN
ncbi:uncharacterized protein LOC126661619 [Mercurialis annua]|uniref:uncharacterized protein LOC126661619 n=1 Tax=Mercurialis annua TaxID=3986 RepID=UPI00215EBEDD|nr:uncharacterized protein LOC126661619 [Mercurialis annua]